MHVKFSINPRSHAQFEAAEYRSLANNQIKIKGFVPVANLTVAIKIIADVKELQKHNNGLEFCSFDSVLKYYPQDIANLLQELILDLDSRGESESTWFDFSFSMQTKTADSTIYENAATFDFVSYYNNLQSQKSSMLLNVGGFDALQSVKPNNVHESFLPILAGFFNPQT